MQERKGLGSDAMTLKTLAYRFMPGPVVDELRHRKHLRDLATAVEPEDAVVRQAVRAGDTALDVGANFGVFTKLFSQLVGPAGSVIAFEPIPKTFRTLSEGIERLHLRNVQPINRAVSDHVGTVFMTVPLFPNSWGDNLYEAHIVPNPDSRTTFAVNTVTVDSLQLSRVDFIKIDVEGHELEVLRGGRETIAKYHPTLMVEVTSLQTVEYLCGEMSYQRPMIVSPSNQLFTHTSRN
jgi:FkbM family methyltransferase